MRWRPGCSRGRRWATIARCRAPRWTARCSSPRAAHPRSRCAPSSCCTTRKYRIGSAERARWPISSRRRARTRCSCARGSPRRRSSAIRSGSTMHSKSSTGQRPCCGRRRRPRPRVCSPRARGCSMRAGTRRVHGREPRKRCGRRPGVVTRCSCCWISPAAAGHSPISGRMPRVWSGAPTGSPARPRRRAAAAIWRAPRSCSRPLPRSGPLSPRASNSSPICNLRARRPARRWPRFAPHPRWSRAVRSRCGASAERWSCSATRRPPLTPAAQRSGWPPANCSCGSRSLSTRACGFSLGATATEPRWRRVRRTRRPAPARCGCSTPALCRCSRTAAEWSASTRWRACSTRRGSPSSAKHRFPRTRRSSTCAPSRRTAACSSPSRFRRRRGSACRDWSPATRWRSTTCAESHPAVLTCRGTRSGHSISATTRRRWATRPMRCARRRRPRSMRTT